MTDDNYTVDFTFDRPTTELLDRHGGNFNDHGVRLNDDGSVDFIFRAMEPGTWDNGFAEFDMSPEFLQRVVGHSYDRLPVQLDHKTNVKDNAGWVPGDKVWFRNDALGLMGHIPDTGNQTRSDIIADFTNDPPAIQDGSLQFDPRSVESEQLDDDTVRMKDAKIMEFSLTHFPSAYGASGGLSPAFSKLAKSGDGNGRGGESRLSTRRKPYRITEK